MTTPTFEERVAARVAAPKVRYVRLLIDCAINEETGAATLNGATAYLGLGDREMAENITDELTSANRTYLRGLAKLIRDRATTAITTKETAR